MKINFDNLAPGEVELVKWQYDMQGGFETALWRCIAMADTTNLGLLALGFENEVRAYIRFSNESGYWEGIQEKAGLTVGG